MKKLIASISGLIAYSFMALPAYAAGNANPCGGTTTGIAKAVCDLQSADIGVTVQNIVVAIVVIAVIIALLYLLYGGIKWIISRGDKTEVEGARNHITAAVVGLIVVFLSIFIIFIVLQLFGIKFSDLKIPSIT